MTDRLDVQRRMTELYSLSSVPLPFDCVIAREIEGRETGETERTLHAAFDPHRTNRSREFLEL